ncbi:hypothetical protein [Parerythrobacter lacustris]|uniref:Uncharacterized protein n=1 Tax=Parerythrobacter lacustris TaxID=2969984 RepID=A0ABT1XQL3_9SPHN|nr:hypothetical protein [Parerythrobacter lacustris]MCR2832935.1 hypothetical protein [Parerythrobacter lacustris]
MTRFAIGALCAFAAMQTPAYAQDIDFGDDESPFSQDGECDDKRFEGSGMTTTPLLDSDVGHDASDCRIAYEQGRLTYSGIAATERRDASHIQWGDDDGQWSNDGECDDMRFEGEGMTSTPLLEEDVRHDATDCRTAYEEGRLELRGSGLSGSASGGSSGRLTPVAIEGRFDWGDNTSQWANDGECDDMRFLGRGLTSTALPEDIGRDEQDCRAAYDAGSVGLNPLFRTPGSTADINYGDDSSSYANDGECDDLRFTGSYASTMIYLSDDVGHDATDCRAAVRSGTARWQADSLPYELGATLTSEALSDDSVDFDKS